MVKAERTKIRKHGVENCRGNLVGAFTGNEIKWEGTQPAGKMGSVVDSKAQQAKKLRDILEEEEKHSRLKSQDYQILRSYNH